jgi:hypothetical protein
MSMDDRTSEQQATPRSSEGATEEIKDLSQAEAGEQGGEVRGGAVTVQDFHFVMRNNS